MHLERSQRAKLNLRREGELVGERGGEERIEEENRGKAGERGRKELSDRGRGTKEGGAERGTANVPKLTLRRDIHGRTDIQHSWGEISMKVQGGLTTSCRVEAEASADSAAQHRRDKTMKSRREGGRLRLERERVSL